MVNDVKTLKAYTDGSCLGNPGSGGWAVIFNNEECTVLKGFMCNTTNNQMELKSVLECIKYVRFHDFGNVKKLQIYSDSAYVVNSINNGWIYKWRFNCWKTEKGAEIKNKTLWLNLFSEIQAMKLEGITSFEMIKVKGHSGVSFNEIVDKIAKEQAKLAKEISQN